MKCPICHQNDGFILNDDRKSATCDTCNTVFEAKPGKKRSDLLIKTTRFALDPESQLSEVTDLPVIALRFLWLVLEGERVVQDNSGTHYEWPTASDFDLVLPGDTDHGGEPGLYGNYFPNYYDGDDQVYAQPAWVIPFKELWKMVADERGNFVVSAYDANDKTREMSRCVFTAVRVVHLKEKAA
jgi:hypothetical protein